MPELRRNVTDRDDAHYSTSRGPFPVDAAHDQGLAVRDIGNRDNASRYPRDYRNEEGRRPDTYRLFAPHEARPGEHYVEVPAVRPGEPSFDLDRRSAPRRQVELSSGPNLHPNDRSRLAANPLNDPGPFRTIVAHNPSTDDRRAAGMTYHERGSPTGYTRASLESSTRESRQMERRYADQTTLGSRSWPPRGYSAEELAAIEREERVRRGGGGGGRRRQGGDGGGSSSGRRR